MKNTFNELDQWLLLNWKSARQLEVSMNEVQDKYKTVCERVINVVQEELRELDNCRTHLESGHLVFAKEKWSVGYKTWPPGLWIWNISLDNLTADDRNAPCAAIWLNDPKGNNFDLQEARTKIQKTSVDLVNGEKSKYSFDDKSDHSTLLWYNMPESRQELGQMLVDSESKKFVECIVSHVMILARFIPVLDEILLKNRP
jgi:hypothetical protein